MILCRHRYALPTKLSWRAYTSSMSISSKDVQEEIKMNGDGGGRNVDAIVTTSRDSSSYPYLFDRDIAVHGVGDKDSNLFTSFITNNWSVGDAPNGGYLMSIAIAAAQRTTKFKDPLSVSAYYTSKSVENESLDIEVTTLSTSRSSSVIQIGFKQLGILRCQFIGTFGDFTSLKGVDYGALIAPQLPPIEKCINSSEIILKALGGMNSLSKNISFLSPPDDPLVIGCLHGRREEVSSASISCWVRFEDGRLPCVLSSSFFLDALPPPILSAVSSNWVPTFEYNVHFWSRPINELPTDTDHTTTSCTADGSVRWLRCRFHTPFVLRGMLYTDGELWDEEGKTLLATSRQLARVLTNIKN